MEQVTPYSEYKEALNSLDNGGRFYHLFTKADDDVISSAELGKLGGIFNDKQKMILFLELSISKLAIEDQKQIISKLDERLKTDYFKYKPSYLLPSEINDRGVLSENLIVTGVPKLIDSNSDFNGFIMIPIMTGKVMTFTLLPLIDQYDVYELRDGESSETFIIAHSRSSQKLPNKRVVVAGVLKELETNKKSGGKKKRFLEAIYHISN